MGAWLGFLFEVVLEYLQWNLCWEGDLRAGAGMEGILGCFGGGGIHLLVLPLHFLWVCEDRSFFVKR